MAEMNLSRAVFLDRDGTISPEKDYIKTTAEFELYDFTVDAVRRLNSAGFKVLVVTNQSGVARGYLTLETLERIHYKMAQLFVKSDAVIDGIYYCPHHPTAGSGSFTRVCSCRKPAVGMLMRAAGDFDLDISRSYIVGDKLTDIIMAKDLSATSILVRTGYGAAEAEKINPEKTEIPHFIADDLKEAVDWIMRKEEMQKAE